MNIGMSYIIVLFLKSDKTDASGSQKTLMKAATVKDFLLIVTVVLIIIV